MNVLLKINRTGLPDGHSISYYSLLLECQSCKRPITVWETNLQYFLLCVFISDVPVDTLWAISEFSLRLGFAVTAFSALTMLVGRQEKHSVCKKLLNDEVLAWLSVWDEVQMICIWSGWCHWHPIISCLVKIQIGLTLLVLAYPGCSGKQAIKRMSVLVLQCFMFHLNNTNIISDFVGVFQVSGD